MRKLMLMSALALSVMSVQAQDYKKPLYNTWQAFDTLPVLNAHDAKLQQANKLGLIAKKWPNEWAPHFYVALSKAMMSYDEKEIARHDAVLDEADKELEEAVSILGKQTDETYVLGAMIANSRMAADPMNRWQKYGKIFSDDLDAAKKINPSNPRMYYLKAISTMFTPKAFGGGKANALPYFEKAQGFFAVEKEDDITKPFWGKKPNALFLAECKKPDSEK
ncbi:MAG: hypothetical protein H7257_05195 [Taibaiella sp.]|nr:hypothetical protein [Taibaiella sp.]